ncbi:hypothetical protein M413DRAFT_450152 [Hebeloma cylindrosporum]|uniref:Uncharacterized protein n=1 Tax=Hebeloma cylindrosporum TaxID=76867 RepID=A0A0C2X9E1_HEBCY|nr:hypothetical protein M413DRAFT_450152 [Hebeloma cylindrosporum h7]
MPPINASGSMARNPSNALDWTAYNFITIAGNQRDREQPQMNLGMCGSLPTRQ